MRERRLDRTRYLLENTRIPLSDIAVMCGFGELSTFSRAFRRSSGVAPSQHRRAARERAASLSPAVA
ncbi:helix-turn-helix domain-containing protein [Microbacterium rhizosphaerae]|uniref:helix-turn-helix domain-containing protein n=1 Tax=Microbacterium rhizosphaerae TaxID=1678237 RepID=UPI0031E867DF